MELVIMVVSLIVFALLGIRLRKEWSSPIYLSGIFWMLYTLVSYASMRKIYSFSMVGIAWIYVAFWMMLFAENLGDRYSKSTPAKPCETRKLSSWSWMYLKACCILGLVAALYQLTLYGFRLSNLTSISALATMNNTIAVARYSGKGIVSGVTQILLIFVYAAPACGGFALVWAEHLSQKMWSVATIFPSVLMVLFTNTKAVAIGAAIIWSSAYLVAYIVKYKHAPAIRRKVVLTVAGIFALFFIFLFFSMTLRMGEISAKTLMNAQRKLLIYAFGEVQSFDWWCANAYESNYKFGTATYLGIANMLGVAKRVQGVYTSYEETASNVFTVFRGVIEDVGFLGGMLYLVIKAFFCGWCFDNARRSKKMPVLSVVFLLAEMFFFIYGFIISTWTYMSYILAIVVFAGYLFMTAEQRVRVKLGRKLLP